MIALIPARSGSKRVPDKNIRELGGIPLMAYSILAARMLPGIESVWVSTDNRDYGKIAWRYEANVCTRPSELATDQATDIQVIEHFIQNTEDLWADMQDICFLRPTTPFRKLWRMEEAIKLWNQSRGEVDSLRSVEEMQESAFKCFIRGPGGLLVSIAGDLESANNPNQNFQKTYKGNGYVDIIKSENILNGIMYGKTCIGYETPQTLEIDTLKDWEIAEAMVAKMDYLKPQINWGERKKKEND